MRKLILILFLGLPVSNLAAAPRVVASIAPLQELTAAIMAGVAEPDVIIEAGSSAHHFKLKPSQMRRLQEADLVIWIDSRFESGFSRIAEILPASTQRLELLPRLDPDAHDGHIWFAPNLLLGSIDHILTALQGIDPANSGRYRANADRLASALRTLEVAIRARWSETPPPVLIDHDFLRPFSDAFGFDPIESVHDGHDDHAGLKNLYRIESLLREGRVRCLLAQSGTVSQMAAELANKYDLRIVNLEPADDRRGVLARLDRLLSAFDACAAPAAGT